MSARYRFKKRTIGVGICISLWLVMANLVLAQGPPPDTGQAPPLSSPDPTLDIIGGYQISAGSLMTMRVRNFVPGNYSLMIETNPHSPYIPFAEYFNNDPHAPSSISVDFTGSGLVFYQIPINWPTSLGLKLVALDTNNNFVDEYAFQITAVDPPALATYTSYGDDDQLAFRSYWPVGTPLDYVAQRLDMNKTYTIEFPQGTNLATSLSPDGDGSIISTFPYVIPPALGPGAGNYDQIANQQIRILDESDSNTPVATQTLQIVLPCIKLDQGSCSETLTAVQDVDINIHVSQHAPNLTYRLTYAER